MASFPPRVALVAVAAALCAGPGLARAAGRTCAGSPPRVEGELIVNLQGCDGGYQPPCDFATAERRLEAALGPGVVDRLSAMSGRFYVIRFFPGTDLSAVASRLQSRQLIDYAEPNWCIAPASRAPASSPSPMLRPAAPAQRLEPPRAPASGAAR